MNSDAMNAADSARRAAPDLLVIRALGVADLPAYKALRDGMLHAFPDAFTSDAHTESRKPAEVYLPRLGLGHVGGGQFTLGAWDDGELLGALTCERENRAKVRHIGHIVGMMVQAEAAGRGIGRALLAACIEQAQAADGIELLTLSVTSSNRRAVRLYEGAGFVRYGTLKHAIKLDGVYHDKDLMSLTLSLPGSTVSR
jgi:ribosomal protein S18 acetylase RimI-like enzyme